MDLVKISNIDFLENVNFTKIKELDLYHNNISDIKVLGKVKFEQLLMLDLRGNEINHNKYSSIIEILKSKLNYLIY